MDTTNLPEREKINNTTTNDGLEGYFNRINYTGLRTPTLATLRNIHALHPQSIPFENLNPFLRIPVRLDLESIQQKIIRGGRGGYCFEQNLLLMHVLRSLGFTVKGLAARVRWNVPKEVETARGHMLLLIDLEGKQYIADVGFGGMVLTSPLLLSTNLVQETTHEPFRLITAGEDYLLQALVRDEWKPLYRFNLQEQLLPDYEVTSWYLSNHPESHFVTGLIAARVSSKARFALGGKELAIHTLDGNTERRTLASASELKSVLVETFGINLSILPQLEEGMQLLFKKEAAS